MLSPVFVVGTGRCGSTLVHELLARHPAFGFVSNLEDRLPLPLWAGRWNGALYRGPMGRYTRKGRVRFAPSEAYRLISRELGALYAESRRDLLASDVTPWLRAGFQRFFERRAALQGVDAFVHKYTGWPRLGFFAEIFPDARFIHILRDGRAVANSWLQMPWWRGYRGPAQWQWGELSPAQQAQWAGAGHAFPALAGLGWVRLMDAFEAAEAALPAGRCLALRYEAVLAQPRASFQRMLEFCGLPWTAAFEQQFARQRFEHARLDAFRRDLAPAQLEALESCVQPRLSQLGYD